MSNGFGGRTGSEVSMYCIFPWGVMAATALVGCRAGVGGTRARAMCEQGLPSSQWFSPPYQRIGMWAEELEQEP